MKCSSVSLESEKPQLSINSQDNSLKNNKILLAALESNLLKNIPKSIDVVNLPEPQHNNININNLIAFAMFYLQQFQQVITKSETDQGQLQANLGKIMAICAQKSQTETDNKVKQELAEQAAAQNTPWWKTLVTCVLAVVSVIISAVTMGAGAAVMVAAMTAFMMSGAFDKVVGAIASAIASDLYSGYYDEYIKEGKSPDEAKKLAQEKSQAIANIIAKVIVIAIIVAISVAAPGAVEGGVEEGAEGGAEGIAGVVARQADMMVDNNIDMEALEIQENMLVRIGGYARRFARGFAKGLSKDPQWKLGISQGLSGLASSNIAQDCFQVDPEWAKKHAELIGWLAAGIGIGLAVLSIVTMMSTYKSSAGIVSRSAKLEAFYKSFAAKSGTILCTSMTAGAVCDSANTYYSAEQAKIFHDLAEFVKEIGDLNGQNEIWTSGAQVNQDTMQMNTETADSITKNVGNQMNSLQNVAGMDWNATNQILS